MIHPGFINVSPLYAIVSEIWYSTGLFLENGNSFQTLRLTHSLWLLLQFPVLAD
jgi:hypothetical protein